MSQKLQQQFMQAVALHQQGKLQEAGAIYEAILKVLPRHPDALHLLGVVALQTGQYQRAADLIGKAIAINPKEVGYYINRGNALHALNQLESAVASFDRAVSLQPNIAEAYFNRGNVLHALNKLEAAVSSFDRAIQLKPDYADAYNNRGRVQQALKQSEAAVASYDRAISINHHHAEAWNNRAIALQSLGQLEAAVASCEQALRIRPNYAEAFKNRGDALLALKQYEAAIASYDQAIHLKMDYAEAFNNRGNALLILNKPESAVTSFDQAISIRPGYAEAFNNRGNALQVLRQFEAAIASYDQAILSKPDYAEAYLGRGAALEALGHFDPAVISYDQAISYQPENAAIYHNRGNAYLALKKLEAATVDYRKALDINPHYEFLHGLLLFIRMKMCDWTGMDDQLAKLSSEIERHMKSSPVFPVLTLFDSLTIHRKAAEIWTGSRFPPDLSLGLIPRKEKTEQIVVGYYSADFRQHPVALLLAGVLEAHDKRQFKTIAFSYTADANDQMQQRISEACSEFYTVQDKSDREVAILSRQLGVDIAIDLGGYTKNSRTGIFALRAAPIQVNFLGYLATMGAAYMDYLIADETIVPVDSRQHYLEKIVFLPSFQPNDRKRSISERIFSRAELGLPEHGFVYCCFNNSYKITPEVFDGWIRILNAVEHSVLWLFADTAEAMDNLRKEAKQRGMDPQRLVFAGAIGFDDYLARYRMADLFLDTLPYNAGTTASDALWVGLPLLTRIGESFAGRMAASLLNAIGLPELITDTQVQYESLAIELARNPVKLSGLKEKLQQNRLTTPLFDTELYTRNLETAYRAMYERYQADLPPEHIYLSDQKVQK